MNGLGARPVRFAGCALAVLLFAGSAAAQNQQAAKPSEKKSPPTVADAQKFLDEAESRYFDLTNKAQRASWVEENFITDDTEQIAADANQELSGFSAEMSKRAHDFDKLTLPAEMARKMLLLKLSAGFPAPADPKDQKELAQVLASLDGDYGKGKWCPGGDASKCLDVTAVGKLMATSRDAEELKRAWIGWHAVGVPMRQRYARMVELGNAGSRELGFADAGALWRSNYDMPPDQLAKEADRLWEQLRPLYESLHAYVRGQLRKK
jgi:peptidyl-dipeptidase A